jgi:hypothetical protein
MRYFAVRCNECCCFREWHAHFYNVSKCSDSFHSASLAYVLTDVQNRVWRGVHMKDIAGSHYLVLSSSGKVAA